MLYIAITAPLVFLAGIIMYALATNPKLQEIGRAMLWCGLLATLLIFGGAHALTFR